MNRKADPAMYPGKIVELHAIEPRHLKNANAWMNDPEIRNQLALWLPQPARATKKWYESMVDDPCHLVYAIITAEGKKHIGNLGLHDIDWKNRNAEFGIVLGDSNVLGKGYGADAVRTVLRMAFHEMTLHRVFLKVWQDNARAIRCYEKCGFHREGVLRQVRFHKGRWYDAVIMGILAPEFEEIERQQCKTKK